MLARTDGQTDRTTTVTLAAHARRGLITVQHELFISITGTPSHLQGPSTSSTRLATTADLPSTPLLNGILNYVYNYNMLRISHSDD